MAHVEGQHVCHDQRHDVDDDDDDDGDGANGDVLAEPPACAATQGGPRPAPPRHRSPPLSQSDMFTHVVITDMFVVCRTHPPDQGREANDHCRGRISFQLKSGRVQRFGKDKSWTRPQFAKR